MMFQGAEAIDLAEAHRKDMTLQDKYHCKCMTYWFDEVKGNAFCLIEAPDKTSMTGMHKESHGLVPNKIIEVNNDVVAAFLGRTGDPEDAEITDTGLKVFSETAFRIILVTELKDPVLMQHDLGSRKSADLMERLNDVDPERIDCFFRTRSGTCRNRIHRIIYICSQSRFLCPGHPEKHNSRR